MDRFAEAVSNSIAKRLGFSGAVPLMLNPTDAGAVDAWLRDELSPLPDVVAQRVKNALVAGVGLECLNIVEFPVCAAAGADDCLVEFRVVGFEEMLAAALGAVREDAQRIVRPPYSREFIPCTCAVVEKDDCACIRAYLDAQQPAA